jgi:hypothetical protein
VRFAELSRLDLEKPAVFFEEEADACETGRPSGDLVQGAVVCQEETVAKAVTGALENLKLVDISITG